MAESSPAESYKMVEYDERLINALADRRLRELRPNESSTSEAETYTSPLNGIQYTIERAQAMVANLAIRSS